MTAFLILMALGLFTFAILALMADSWDARERRDARRRNRP